MALNQKQNIMHIYTKSKLFAPERVNEKRKKCCLHVTQVESPWKKYRDGIVACVEKLIKTLQTPDTCLSANHKPEAASDELWDRFAVAIATVVNDLDLSEDVCIVIDDNMFYTSMRYGYFQLARKCKYSIIGFPN